MSRTVARPETRRALRRIAAGLVVVAAAVYGNLAHRSASAPAPTFNEGVRRDHRGTSTGGDDADATEADGALPAGVTVFDGEYAGIANLHPDLLRALRAAAADAGDDGIEFYVNSGWRSPRYQDQLLREAVAEYGSEYAASRWVATAGTSAHVSGEAVDVGHTGATDWLFEHGVEYGLCQIYRNEPWHFELRPEAVGHRCPRMYADPSHDPRMRR